MSVVSQEGEIDIRQYEYHTRIMSFRKTVLTAGFAMFSMFFGSGNLVFPLVIGTQTVDNMGYAMLGLFITGVLVPFLGLLGVILYSGNRSNYFACIGKVPAFILTFIMLAIMGPIGVLPRCIIVAYGGITLFAPNFPFWMFSAIFCVMTLLLVWNHDRVIPIIGRMLTPILLLGIVTIAVAGLAFTDSVAPVAQLNPKESFWTGLFEGYQTMDLLAAFFFSATTVAYIKAHLRSDNSPKQLLKLSLTASIIGAGFIGVVYLCFVALGAKHAPLLLQVSPEQMFSSVAGHALGPIAIPIVAITIALACLTTAVVLAMLFADFVHEDISKYKFGQHKAVILTLIISFLVSLVGFSSLRIWIGAILEIAYPALIVLTIANISSKLWNAPHWGRWGFWITVIVSLIYKYVF